MRRFVIRWSLVVFGVLAMVTGARDLLFGERLDEDAREVSAGELSTLTADHGEHFVRVEGEIDAERTIYRTALQKPRYVARDTNRQYAMDPTGADAPAMVGQTVSVTGTLGRQTVELQTIEMRNGESAEEGELRGLHVFAVIAESAGRIVVVSPGFSSQDDPDYAHWLRKATHAGVVSRLDDLRANRPGFENGGHDVRGVFASLGVMIAPNAVVMFTDIDGTRRPRECYAPLAGAGGAVFAQLPPGGSPGGPITGMARAADTSSYEGFNAAYGGRLPGRFVIVDTTRTAADLNAQAAGDATAMLTTGAFMAGIGGFWVFMRRRSAKRRVAMIAQDLEDLDRINREGAGLTGFRDAA